MRRQSVTTATALRRLSNADVVGNSPSQADSGSPLLSSPAKESVTENPSVASLLQAIRPPSSTLLALPDFVNSIRTGIAPWDDLAGNTARRGSLSIGDPGSRSPSSRALHGEEGDLSPTSLDLAFVRNRRVPINVMSQVVSELEAARPALVNPTFSRGEARKAGPLVTEEQKVDTVRSSPGVSPAPRSRSPSMREKPEFERSKRSSLSKCPMPQLANSNRTEAAGPTTVSKSASSPAINIGKRAVATVSLALTPDINMMSTSQHANALQPHVKAKVPLSTYVPGTDRRMVTAYRAPVTHAAASGIGSGASVAVPVGYSSYTETMAREMDRLRRAQDRERVATLRRQSLLADALAAAVAEARAMSQTGRYSMLPGAINRNLLHPATIQPTAENGLLVLQRVARLAQYARERAAAELQALQEGSDSHLAGEDARHLNSKPSLSRILLDSRSIRSHARKQQSPPKRTVSDLMHSTEAKHANEAGFSVHTLALDGQVSSRQLLASYLARRMPQLAGLTGVLSAEAPYTSLVADLAGFLPDFDVMEDSERLLELTAAVTDDNVLEEAAKAGISLPAAGRLKALLQGGLQLATSRESEKKGGSPGSLLGLLDSVRGFAASSRSVVPLTREEDEHIAAFIQWWGSEQANHLRTAHLLRSMANVIATEDVANEIWASTSANASSRTQLLQDALADEKVLAAARAAGISVPTSYDASLSELLLHSSRQLVVPNSRTVEGSQLVSDQESLPVQPSAAGRTSVTSRRTSIKIRTNETRIPFSSPGTHPEESKAASDTDGEQKEETTSDEQEGSDSKSSRSSDASETDSDTKVCVSRSRRASLPAELSRKSTKRLERKNVSRDRPVIAGVPTVRSFSRLSSAAAGGKAERNGIAATDFGEAGEQEGEQVRHHTSGVEAIAPPETNQVDAGHPTGRTRRVRAARYSAPDVSVTHAPDAGALTALKQFREWFENDTNQDVQKVRNEFIMRKLRKATEEIAAAVVEKSRSRGAAESPSKQPTKNTQQGRPKPLATAARKRADAKDAGDLSSKPAFPIISNAKPSRSSLSDNSTRRAWQGSAQRGYAGTEGDPMGTAEQYEATLPNDLQPRGLELGDRENERGTGGQSSEDARDPLVASRRQSLIKVEKVAIDAEKVVQEAQLHVRVLLAAIDLLAAAETRKKAEETAAEAEMAAAVDDDEDVLREEGAPQALVAQHNVASATVSPVMAGKTVYYFMEAAPNNQEMHEVERAAVLSKNGLNERRAGLLDSGWEAKMRLHYIEAYKRCGRAAVQEALVRAERFRWGQLTKEQREIAKERHGAAKEELSRRKREDKEREEDPGNLTIAEKMAKCKRTAHLVKLAYPAFCERAWKISLVRTGLWEEHKRLRELKASAGKEAAEIARTKWEAWEALREQRMQELELMSFEDALSRRREAYEAEFSRARRAAERTAYETFVPFFKEDVDIPLLTVRDTARGGTSKHTGRHKATARKSLEPLLEPIRQSRYESRMSARFRIVAGIPPTTASMSRPPRATSPLFAGGQEVTDSKSPLRIPSVEELRGESLSPSNLEAPLANLQLSLPFIDPPTADKIATVRSRLQKSDSSHQTLMHASSFSTPYPKFQRKDVYHAPIARLAIRGGEEALGSRIAAVMTAEKLTTARSPPTAPLSPKHGDKGRAGSLSSVPAHTSRSLPALAAVGPFRSAAAARVLDMVAFGAATGR